MSTDDPAGAAIEQRLRDAQKAVLAARAATEERRAAVAAALAAKWSKYRIAAVLGVKGPTVDAIVKTIESRQDLPEDLT